MKHASPLFRPLACILAVVMTVWSVALGQTADFPRSPKLHGGSAELTAGGYQVVVGENPNFEIFTYDGRAGELRLLGRYNGELAGVAAADDGRILSLTRDGALNVCGDDSASLAYPDSRWRMLGLTWWRGAPLAVTADGGRLFVVRPGDGNDWRQDEKPIARVESANRLVLVAHESVLHLLVSARSNDLSGGAIRHLTLKNGSWSENRPLPLGDVLDFAAFVEDGVPNVAALIPDLVDPDTVRAVHRVLRNGVWQEQAARDLPPALADALGIAAASGRGRPIWLTTGPGGAFLTPPSAADRTPPPGIAVAPGTDSSFGWSHAMQLLTFVGLAALLFIYCRRSQALSRRFPARPPDMISRAAALGVDWFLVSVAMSAYHIANGDVRILPGLLNMGDAMTVFWTNLAALCLFMGVTEAIYGCTPGKRLAGLRVRSVVGGPPRLVQIVSRNLFRVIDMFPLPIGFPGLLGAIVAMLGPRRQRLGDLLAATAVRRHLPLRGRKFLLASASPRRLELLQALGLDVRAVAPDIDEESYAGGSPEETVRLLAEAKAKAAAPSPELFEIVVAADTVVVLDGQVMGKPKDALDAVRMLGLLSGRSHTVFTGVTVCDTATGQRFSDVEQTEVEFRQLSPGEIEKYVASGEPMDKAGAYGVQSGYLVKQVRGSLSNVAGLPMERLQGMLAMLDS